MSSRSALPSGNDRSTGEHVSAITAYSLYLCACKINKYINKWCILKQRYPDIVTPLSIYLVYLQCRWIYWPMLFFLLDKRTREVILDGYFSRAGSLKMGYPWVSVQGKSWWQANSPEWVHPHTITLSGYAQKASIPAVTSYYKTVER